MDVHAGVAAEDAPSYGVPGTEDGVRTERVRLGEALLARSGDILRMCQERAVGQTPGLTLDLAVRHPMWDIVTVAVEAIADWLTTGTRGRTGAPPDRSLGNAAAVDQEAAIASRSSDNQ